MVRVTTVTTVQLQYGSLYVRNTCFEHGDPMVDPSSGSSNTVYYELHGSTKRALSSTDNTTERGVAGQCMDSVQCWI